jgi:hypothetical protein
MCANLRRREDTVKPPEDRSIGSCAPRLRSPQRIAHALEDACDERDPRSAPMLVIELLPHIARPPGGRWLARDAH